METAIAFNERTGWGHVWISPEWKRQFLVLAPGALKVFSCDRRSKMEKNLLLRHCAVGVHTPFPDLKLPKFLLKKRQWRSLSNFLASDRTFSQAQTIVVTIKLKREKTCFLIFRSLEEAETWKTGIEEAAILIDARERTKEFKKLSRRSKALQQVSEAFEQRKKFFQSKSLLKIPFGLRWEAYPTLFKIQLSISQLSPRSLTVSETKTGSDGNINTKLDAFDKTTTQPLWPDLTTLRGCTDFLYSSYLNFRALQHATLMVDHFKGSYQMGEASLPDELRLEAWKGTTKRIVAALVDRLLANNPSLEPCLDNRELMEQLWSASEVWVFGAIDDKIMGACKQMYALKDASMDTILAKLEKVDPTKLGVRAEFENFVIGEALNEFRLLNRLRSPYEKALCLQRTVRCIVDGIQNLIKSCTALNDAERLLPCTDDLLSLMLLLMARTRVKYLHANACYMENFINLQKDANRGELLYHITNFVAACNYLLSDEAQDLILDISKDVAYPSALPQLSMADLRTTSLSSAQSVSSIGEFEPGVPSTEDLTHWRSFTNGDSEHLKRKCSADCHPSNGHDAVEGFAVHQSPCQVTLLGDTDTPDFLLASTYQ